MTIDQPPERIKTLVGYNETTGEIKDLALSCLRKPLKAGQQIRQPYFAFVSNPNFVHNEIYNPFMWLHCFRNPSWLKGDDKHKYLFPESDFMDEAFINRIDAPIKYDYCYFTLNDLHSGGEYKGFPVFLNSLEVFHSLGLRGVVVSYFGYSRRQWVFALTARQKQLLKGVDVIWSKLGHNDVAKIMASSKFSFFPNIKDCSPRMIPESFIRNRPVVVNNEIYGGWHYIEKDPAFGALFQLNVKKSLEEAIIKAINLPRNQLDIWRKYYGFESSTRKLASLVQQYQGDMGITHLYFNDFRKVFQKWSKKRG